MGPAVHAKERKEMHGTENITSSANAGGNNPLTIFCQGDHWVSEEHFHTLSLIGNQGGG